MKERETRRVYPVANITALLVLAVVALEAFVILGGLETKAQTVAKYAPWFLDTYLSLTSVPPEADEPSKTPKATAAVKSVSGLVPEAIPMLGETNGIPVAATNQLLEPSIPVETNAVPEAGAAPEAPATNRSEIVPVG